MTKLGIIKGHPSGEYKPNDTLLRAEMGKLFALIMGLGVDELTEGQNWFEVFITALENAGVIKKGLIPPESKEARANLLAFIIKAKGINLNTLPACVAQPYNDVDIDQWYCSVVEYARENGFLSDAELSTETFSPGNEVTRSTAAGWLFRAFYSN